MNREAIIKRMVDRFLEWELPAEFSPDCGITYTAKDDFYGNPPTRPVGTNLFTAEQAAKMLESIAQDEIDFLLHRIALLAESEHAKSLLLAREGRLHKECIEERDSLRAKCAELEAENEKSRIAILVAKQQVTDKWTETGLLSERIRNDHLYDELCALRAKCAAMQKVVDAVEFATSAIFLDGQKRVKICTEALHEYRKKGE